MIKNWFNRFHHLQQTIGAAKSTSLRGNKTVSFTRLKESGNIRVLDLIYTEHRVRCGTNQPTFCPNNDTRFTLDILITEPFVVQIHDIARKNRVTNTEQKLRTFKFTLQLYLTSHATFRVILNLKLLLTSENTSYPLWRMNSDYSSSKSIEMEQLGGRNGSSFSITPARTTYPDCRITQYKKKNMTLVCTCHKKQTE